MVRRGNAEPSGGLVKLYYRIGEVSRLVGVAPHVLRYWESEFRSVRPQKSSHGQRVYSKKDVQKLLTIKELLKSQGFTIEGARKRLREMATAGETVATELNPAGLTPVSPPVELAPSEEVLGPVSAEPHGKRLRSALTHVRAELVEWLGELQAAGSTRR
jgi:DNA-binding transcriptional MerR regulator